MQQEKIVETKICKHCNSSFEITDKDLEFYEKVSPIVDGEKFLIPTPNLCPICREKRRMIWRNEMNLFRRKCDFSGEDIISMHSSEYEGKVYHNKYWWGDKHEGLDYGIDINFDKSIFEQIESLIKVVPRLHRFCFSEDKMINSDYTNCAGNLKNCYLVFGASKNEFCMYSTYINDSNYCFDCLFSINSQNCFESINIKNCYNLFYSQNSETCNDCYYISDCLSCLECLGCAGLINKKYHILNKSYNKETYKSEKEKFLNNKELLKKEYEKLLKIVPKRYINGINNENIIGDYIFNSKNIINSFDISNAEDCKYCSWFTDGKNCMDFFARGFDTELCYEIVGGGDKMYKCAFTAESFTCKDCYYVDLCVYCDNCFACIGLKNKKYCILNKQYTKERYNETIPKIIKCMQEVGEWGEHFSFNMSPFCYNESVAQKYYPLTKQEVLNNGFNWSDYEVSFPKVEKIIQANKLPENIKDIPDDILNRAIECEVTKKPFRIIKQELEFYRKHNLPIPRRHPDQRHLDRMALRNPRKLYNRKCDKCHIDMKTTFAPDREEIVYCEECYNKEIY